jgi:hypothetical protein
MNLSIKFLVVSTISLSIACVVLAYGMLSGTAKAQTDSGGLVVTHMTGDSDGVWLATNDERLIHCWFPQDAARTSERANCRVIERFRVNVLR